MMGTSFFFCAPFDGSHDIQEEKKRKKTVNETKRKWFRTGCISTLIHGVCVHTRKRVVMVSERKVLEREKETEMRQEKEKSTDKTALRSRRTFTCYIAWPSYTQRAAEGEQQQTCIFWRRGARTNCKQFRGSSFLDWHYFNGKIWRVAQVVVWRNFPLFVQREPRVVKTRSHQPEPSACIIKTYIVMIYLQCIL